MNLTNKHREAIIAVCIKTTFGGRNEAYEKSRVAFGDALYAHEYGEHEKAANKLPDGWLNTTGEMNISRSGFKHWSSEKGCPASFAMSKHRRVPRHNSHTSIPNDHPLAEMADAILDEFQAIEAAESELRNAITGVVYACTTREKLLDAWPEGEPFLPPVEVRRMALVPVDLKNQVNKIMGLKPSKKAAKP